MLAEKNAAATIAVRDVKTAKKFYEDVLGLKPVPNQEQGVLSYKSGDSSILVYESQYAGTNKATAATWLSATTSKASCATRRARESASSTTTFRAPRGRAIFTFTEATGSRGSRIRTGTS